MEICIISVPGGTDDQINQIGAALSASNIPTDVPIYVTKATVKPVSLDDIKELRDHIDKLLEKCK